MDAPLPCQHCGLAPCNGIVEEDGEGDLWVYCPACDAWTSHPGETKECPMPDLFGDEPYAGLTRSAELSEDGRYRWWLARNWARGGNGKALCFVMLNPSTADAEREDPTLRRCLGYTQAWGYSTLVVRNLYPLRAADPGELLKAEGPTGGERGDRELAAARAADLVVCAWGVNDPFGRAARALELLAGTPLFCLGVTRHRHPRHPLYAKADLRPVPFEP